MGYDISKSVSSPEELMKTVMQCLKRDKDWIRYHAETLADRTEQPRVDTQAIEIAWRERAYIGYCLQNDFDRAIGVIRELPDVDAKLDRHIRGWLWQLGARAALLAKQENLSHEMQRQAFSANNMLIPPAVKPKYEPVVEIGQQVGNILDEVTRYALRKGALDEFERTVALLSPSATSNQFEEGLKRFGELLGFRAQRPEHQFRAGSDVLWLSGTDYCLVIECKHRKDAKNALTKEEHGQLLTSQQWAQDNYPKRKIIGLIVHPTDESTKPAAAEKTSVLTLAKLGELVGVARQFYNDLCSSTAQGAALEKVCSELLAKHGLSAEEIGKRFLTTFKCVK
jgi:hypothetical protein